MWPGCLRNLSFDFFLFVFLNFEKIVSHFAWSAVMSVTLFFSAPDIFINIIIFIFTFIDKKIYVFKTVSVKKRKQSKQNKKFQH